MANVLNLRALQTFNMVAKTGNLTRAAGRLGVTQGAVSHQVRALEKGVGFQLLVRHAFGVSLTERGRKLFQSTEPAFRLLESGLEDVSRRVKKHNLMISLPTALATKWFVPRLATFKERHPDINLFLDTTDDLIDFETSEVDIAIRFARPREGNFHFSKIRDEVLVAVASPHLLSEVRKRKRSPVLHDFPILEDTFDSRWDQWIELSGLSPARPMNSTIRYSDSAVMISAAVNGQGLALARKIMVEDDLAHGRLELFNDVEVKLERQLLFLCRRNERSRPEIAALRQWLSGLG